MKQLLGALDILKEQDPMNFFEQASKITEAYCVEHNLPCKRRYKHDELLEAFQAVRDAHRALYVAPAPAEACSDVGVAS